MIIHVKHYFLLRLVLENVHKFNYCISIISRLCFQLKLSLYFSQQLQDMLEEFCDGISTSDLIKTMEHQSSSVIVTTAEVHNEGLEPMRSNPPSPVDELPDLEPVIKPTSWTDTPVNPIADVNAS